MSKNTLPLILLLALTMSLQVKGFMPFTRSLWDFDDPFRILEQTPLPIPKNNLDTPLALARSDWKETQNAHVISLDIPGMKKEDVKIEVEENRVLRISGERKADVEHEGEKWHRAERTTGKFWRQFRLPVNADLDHIQAHLEDGVLRITVPKIAEEKKRQSKVIDIAVDNSSGKDIKATKADA